MDPRKLRKLLEILNEFGVKEYKTDKIQINLDPSFKVSDEETEKVFSMDNYTGSGGEGAEEIGEDYNDEQILHWSSRA